KEDGVGYCLMPCQPCFLSCLRHRMSDRGHDFSVENAWYYIVLMQLIICYRIGDGLCSGKFYFLIYSPGPYVQQPPENSGKAQHIIYLVGIIGASGGEYPY